jgi:hypothetical protein
MRAKWRRPARLENKSGAISPNRAPNRAGESVRLGLKAQQYQWLGDLDSNQD